MLTLIMTRRVVVCCLLGLAACRDDSKPMDQAQELGDVVPEGRGVWPTNLADSLLRLGVEDQQGRNALAQAAAAQDTATLFATLRADSARSRWLKQQVAQFGWPQAAQSSDSAVQAAWLILQHSPDTAWQADMLPVLEQLAASGALPTDDVAMLADRVQVRRGEPQRYATQFTMVDGRMLPEPVGDTVGLDARRAAVGLPPMAEYVRRMQEQFRVPVVWPPPR